MKILNVLYLNDSMAMGGIETMILDFSMALPRERFNPQVAVFRSGGVLEKRLSENGIKTHSLNKNDGLDLGLFFRIYILLIKQKINILHTNNYSA